MGDSTVPEKRFDRNGNLVTRHVNPAVRPDANYRRLRELKHLLAKTTTSNDGVVFTKLSDDPLGLLLANPQEKITLGAEEIANSDFKDVELLSLSFLNGHATVYAVSRHSVDQLSETYAATQRNADPKKVRSILEGKVDDINEVFESTGNRAHIKIKDGILTVASSARFGEDITDIYRSASGNENETTWEDIYLCAADNGLLVNVAEDTESDVYAVISNVLTKSKRFRPGLFSKRG